MLEYPTISKRKPEFPDYLNFQTLRDIGIAHLQTLSGKIWTDYNLHDPGVTILEVLCYTVTDLGYRNNLDIQDLLALDSQQPENNFFTPDQILTCNPVTNLDLRKRLIDIPGVRNAWIEKFTEELKQETEANTKKVSTYHPPIYIDYVNSQLQPNPPDGETEESASRLHPRGLYTVYIDLDWEYRQNACGQISRSWSDTLEQVKTVLCNHRNLCEDIHDIVVLGTEEIGLCSDIELTNDADAEDILVEIYVKMQEFLSPRLRFYTLQELLTKGKNIEEIFAGRPSVEGNSYNSHGFIDTDELSALVLPPVIHTSDLYQEILKIPGVVAVRRLSIANYINGLPQSQSSWNLPLTKGYSPVLGIEQSKVTLFKGILPISLNGNEVKRRYYEQQSAHIKVLRQDNELDLSVPYGSYYDLADHYSIQHDFPLSYGIGEDGLPKGAKALRKAQARQLKGYLVFFDQLLANYLVQLAHVRDLFSWDGGGLNHAKTLGHKDEGDLGGWWTYFSQELDFPDRVAIVGEGEGYLEAVKEEGESRRDRCNRFLDHLLGRFAESFTDYALVNYRMIGDGGERLMGDKARFLKDYPGLSRDRFRGFDYCNYQQVWDTENVSGLQKRVSRLLGFEDIRRRHLCHYRVDRVSGGFVGFAVSWGDLSLVSLQTYDSEKAALGDISKVLLFALHESFYQRLSYSYFYHYGLEVEAIEEGEFIIARYEAYFCSQWERIAGLDFLVGNLVNLFNLEAEDGGEEILAISTISGEDIIKIVEIQEKNLYYFQLEIPVDSSQFSQVIRFVGVQHYFSEPLARQAANAILTKVTHRENYHPILFRQDNSAERETFHPSDETRFIHYGYALVDHQGHVLAESSDRFPEKKERETALQSWLSCLKFNPHQYRDFVEQFLQIEEVTGESAGYRFRLIDREGVTILQGLQLLNDENMVRDRFYQDVLSVLFEPGAIEPIKTQAGYSFRVLIEPRNRRSAVAISPLFYSSETERDAAIEHLFLLVRSAGLNINFFSRLESVAFWLIYFLQWILVSGKPNLMRYVLTELGYLYIGRVYDRNNRVLLQAKQYHGTPEFAWQQGDILMELAGTKEEFATGVELEPKNFRLIDPEITSNSHPVEFPNSEERIQKRISIDTSILTSDNRSKLPESCDNFQTNQSIDEPYGWELTNREKDQILATSYFTSIEERNQSIQELQQLINDEGFHVLEHILLRPKTTSDTFLPICIHGDDGINKIGKQALLTYQDPYSFWITIILPYWTERFRNIDFRNFVEQTLRLEAPAHVALKIAWVNVQQMSEFELAYHNWLEQLAWETGNGSSCNLSGTLNNLIKIISQLRNIYPQGILYDPQVKSKEQPIILNQTAIGTGGD